MNKYDGCLLLLFIIIIIIIFGGYYSWEIANLKSDKDKKPVWRVCLVYDNIEETILLVLKTGLLWFF